jgi:hypothetical protein
MMSRFPEVRVLEPPLERVELFVFLTAKNAALAPLLADSLANMKKSGRFAEIVAQGEEKDAEAVVPLVPRPSFVLGFAQTRNAFGPYMPRNTVGASLPGSHAALAAAMIGGAIGETSRIWALDLSFRAPGKNTLFFTAGAADPSTDGSGRPRRTRVDGTAAPCRSNDTEEAPR